MLRLTERFAASLRLASTVNTTVAVPKAKPFTHFLTEESTQTVMTSVVKFSKWCASRWNNFTDAQKKKWSEEAKKRNEEAVAEFLRLPVAEQAELLLEYKAMKQLRMERKFAKRIAVLLEQHEAKESSHAMLDAGMLNSAAFNSGSQGTASDGGPSQHGDSDNDDDRDHELTQAKIG